MTAANPYVEIFIEDATRRWGYQCFTCGFEQTNVTDFATAEEHADSHVCRNRCQHVDPDRGQCWFENAPHAHHVYTGDEFGMEATSVSPGVAAFWASVEDGQAQ